MDAQLRAWWLADAGPGADDVLERLLARHREPHRRYHGVGHVRAVVGSRRHLLADIEVPDPLAVHLAAWYHDAVYDPTAGPGANEAASAALAAADLAALGHDGPRIGEVGRLIALTATHDAPEGDRAAAVLCDADLAVLGAGPGAYAAYVRGVRAEYAHVDDDAWRAGRAGVLRAFLERDVLYRTAPMRRSEARARANLAAELAVLGA